MALIQVNYLSKSLFRTVPVNVILPSDKIDYMTGEYLKSNDLKFRTLYLLHGLLGNYTDWVSGTRIQRWAEERNLAVVMPSGDNSFYFDGRMPMDDYETFIGRELPEVMRRMFPLSEKREDNFIAGLSMGGYGAFRNGIVYSDTFSHVAEFSGALHLFEKKEEDKGLKEFDKKLFEDVEAAGKTDLNPKVAYEEMIASGRPVPRFYMSCGTRDPLYKANVEMRDFLKGKGADVTWDEEDRAHDWDFWDSQILKCLEWLPLGEADSGLGSGNVKVNE
jgi:S-formylglutathione hydrolase FrmB